MAKKIKQIPAQLLEKVVTGVNLRAGTFRDQVGDQPTLVVFLRHFG